MRSSRKSVRLLACLIGALALLSTSCDDGIGLLTTDEKQSLYVAEASAKGSLTAATYRTPGIILDPSEGVKIVFEALKGSEEPAELVVTLKDGSGGFSTTVRYHTGASSTESQSGSASAEFEVPSLASFSQTLAVPQRFPDGYYELTLDARSDRSEPLSYTQIRLFLVRGSVPSPSIQAYPANPAPGSRVLLVADLDGYEDADPYLRWTVDGSVRSEGTVSEGKGTLLWPAPLAGSAAPVTLALYPVPPPSGIAYSFPAPRSASASLLVSSDSPASLDEFGDVQRFLALFRMEDSADYTGTAAGSGFFLGTPRLDVHAGGFGLTMGGEDASGIQGEALLLPVQDGMLRPFSLLARMVPHSPADGTLFKAASDSSGMSLEVRLSEGRPALVLRAGERFSEIKANAFLSAGLAGFLAVSVLPEGQSLRVQFIVDGKPAGGGTLPFGASGWTAPGVTVVAGPGGCPGLYDEVGVWAFDFRNNPAVFPAFRFASLRKFRSSLRVAEGFEGEYGSELLLAGGASVSASEGLRLPAGSGAVFDLSIDAPFKAEAVLATGGRVRLSLAGSAGTAYIPLDAASGRVDEYSGLPLVSVSAEPSGTGTNEGLSISTADGSVLRLEGAGPWRLGLASPESGAASVRFFRVLRPERIAEE